MKNWISSAIDRISSVLNALQVKRFLAVVVVGFLLLTTNVDSGRNNQRLTDKVLDTAHEKDSVRPKTTNEWYQEARETEDSPGERLKNIAKESGKALKEFGSVYPDTAKTSADALDENTAPASRNFSK
ncbi:MULTISPECIES: hypothetical protein [Aerosakkonema]|uniref:hypothetical protein n=1 Tax=Aerosakkonema TaxID=1246629 RepID=UPI0035BB015E